MEEKNTDRDEKNRKERKGMIQIKEEESWDYERRSVKKNEEKKKMIEGEK